MSTWCPSKDMERCRSVLRCETGLGLTSQHRSEGSRVKATSGRINVSGLQEGKAQRRRRQAREEDPEESIAETMRRWGRRVVKYTPSLAGPSVSEERRGGNGRTEELGE